MQKVADAESILLLDDDQHFRQMVMKLLGAAGHSTIEARTAMEATPLVVSRRPTLIIVDYKLPGMDGITWIEQMRNSGISTTMVLLTSTGREQLDISHLEALKVSMIIQKPINPATFLQQIERMMPKLSLSEDGHV
jgi:DNA-binding response OmpR family regulator